MAILSVLLILFGASTLAVAAPTVEKRQTTDKPYQLRTDQDPVYHFYLQTDPTNCEYSLPTKLFDYITTATT
jgi:hypothetical protein